MKSLGRAPTRCRAGDNSLRVLADTLVGECEGVLTLETVYENAVKEIRDLKIENTEQILSL